MNFFVAIAMLAAGAVQPTSQIVRLECDILSNQLMSYGGRQPMRQVVFDVVTITIDRGARTALFEVTNPDGTPSITLRHISAITGDTMVICQADVCQQAVEYDGWTTTVGLTLLNLKTLTLNRRIVATTPAGAGSTLGNTRTIVREGRCRML